MGRGAQTHVRLRAELHARQGSRTEIEEGEIDETVEASAPSGNRTVSNPLLQKTSDKFRVYIGNQDRGYTKAF